MPAARGVERGGRIAQRARAVRDVPLEVRVRGGRVAEALDLPLRVRRVGVGGREMAHQADHLERRRRELGDAPAAHPGVELHVDAHARRNLVRPDDELETRVARMPHLAVAGGTHDDDARDGKSRRSASALGDGGDAQRRCARAERRAGDVGRAVPVRVRLDDRPQLRAVRGRRAACARCGARRRGRSSARCGARFYASTRGSASMRSPATRPARCGASTDASCCAAAPAAAATCASIPLARKAPTMPVRTSPVPAVASEGSPSAETMRPRPGAATSVSAPFRRTTQRKRSTASSHARRGGARRPPSTRGRAGARARPRAA